MRGGYMSVQGDCNRLLDEFHTNVDPIKLYSRTSLLTDEEKHQRIKDVYNFMDEIGFPYFLYFYNVIKGNSELAEKVILEIKEAANKNKEGILRLSKVQNNILQKCFPPLNIEERINFSRLQKCAEYFANGYLKNNYKINTDIWIILIAFSSTTSMLGLKKCARQDIILIKSAITAFSAQEKMYQ
jgi:hypothetical protein